MDVVQILIELNKHNFSYALDGSMSTEAVFMTPTQILVLSGRNFGSQKLIPKASNCN